MRQQANVVKQCVWETHVQQQTQKYEEEDKERRAKNEENNHKERCMDFCPRWIHRFPPTPCTILQAATVIAYGHIA
jgi:hypothetical protein